MALTLDDLATAQTLLETRLKALEDKRDLSGGINVPTTAEKLPESKDPK